MQPAVRPGFGLRVAEFFRLATRTPWRLSRRKETNTPWARGLATMGPAARCSPFVSSCNADCACPLRCVNDPNLGVTGYTPRFSGGALNRICELCDGGSCQSVGGSCVPPDPALGLTVDRSLPRVDQRRTLSATALNSLRYQCGIASARTFVASMPAVGLRRDSTANLPSRTV